MSKNLVSGFGSVVVDVLMISNGFNINQKNLVAHQTIQVGGVIPTALITLSRLGVLTKIHTMIGNDLFGEVILSILRKEKVALGKIAKIKNRQTPLAFVVIHKKTGHRTSFYTTGAFPNLSHSAFLSDLNPQTVYLLVDGHNNQATADLMEKANQKDIKVFLDLGSPKKDLTKLITKSYGIIVPQAYWKVVWPNQKPQQIIEKLTTFGPRLIVLTMEEKGCFVGQKDDIFYQPSFKVNALDTNGAGDIFFGTFIYGLLQNWPVRKTARFASAAAALSCTKIGKDEKIPRSQQDIINFMQSTPIN